MGISFSMNLKDIHDFQRKNQLIGMYLLCIKQFKTFNFANINSGIKHKFKKI